LADPISIGDRFRWSNGSAAVEVLDMYIAEDGNVQVRVQDGEERRTVTAGDVVDRVAAGELVPGAEGNP